MVKSKKIITLFVQVISKSKQCTKLTTKSKFKILFILGFMLVLKSNAQTIQYSPLRCKGEIHKDFLSLSSNKVIDEREVIKKKNISKKDKNTELDFTYSSIFGIDEILFSGEILYGDVLTTYVNKVADVALASDLTLRKELRFYVLKSNEVNAFSTYQGIVFVTVGLLSQIENEAQLAFILCHEIAHYKLKHTINSYKNKKDLKKGKGKFSSLSLNEKVKEVYNYSKENELEADKEGFKMYQKTKYSHQAVITSFDMLLYSYLAYDELEWSPKILEDSLYKFPTNLSQKKEKKIKADEEEDDEESTHPNIRKRKENLEKKLLDETSSDTAVYIVGEKEFNFIQKQARTELFFTLIKQTNFKQLYYYSYLYRENYKEDSVFCNYIEAFSFYGLSLRKEYISTRISTKDIEIIVSEKKSEKDKFEGAFSSVNTFLNNMGAKEARVLSVRSAWKNYLNNQSDNKAYELFCKSVFVMFKNHGFSKSYFKSIDTVAVVNKKTTIETTRKLTKSEKLKLKQKEQKESAEEEDEGDKKNKSTYYRLAFVKNYENIKFTKMFDSISAIAIEQNKLEEENKDKPKAKARKEDDYKFKTKYGRNYGIDSLILLNPNYSTYKYKNKGLKINLAENEKNELFLTNTYMEMAKANDIDLNVINIYDRENLTTEKLNEYGQIVDWLTERINNGYENSILYNYESISTLTDNRKCSKLMISGIVYVEESRKLLPGNLILSIIVYPILPIVIAYYTDKDRYFKMTSLILDLKTGELLYIDRNEMSFKARKNMVRNQVFSLFHQIKTKKN